MTSTAKHGFATHDKCVGSRCTHSLPSSLSRHSYCVRRPNALQSKVGVRSRVRFYDSKKSFILSGLVQVGALGSLTTTFASLTSLRKYTSNRQRRLAFHRPKERTVLSGTCLLALVKNESIFILSPFSLKRDKIVSQSVCKVNGMVDSTYRSAA